MTFWPMTLLRYACPTPMRPVTIGRKIISPTNRLSRNQFCCGIATSIRSFSSSGFRSPRMLVTMIAKRTTPTWIRYGRKKAAIRLIVWPRRSLGTGVKSLDGPPKVRRAPRAAPPVACLVEVIPATLPLEVAVRPLRLSPADMHERHGVHLSKTRCTSDAYSTEESTPAAYPRADRPRMARGWPADGPRMARGWPADGPRMARGCRLHKRQMGEAHHHPRMGWDSFLLDWDDDLTARGFAALGRLVRRRRHQLGITQNELEWLSGIDQTLISKLENGRLEGHAMVPVRSPGGCTRWARRGRPRTRMATTGRSVRHRRSAISTPRDLARRG